MKKVLSLVAIMLILLLVLTGCVNVNYEVTVNEDGSADVSYIYGFEKESLAQMGATSEEMTNDMKQTSEANGYTVEAYSDDEIEGFKASKHFDNSSNIKIEETFGDEYIKDSNNGISVEKKGIKTVFSKNSELDLTGIDSSMESMFKIKYTIKLPIKAGKNNAQEVSKDGRTLTWELKTGEINKIEFEATKINTVIKIAIILVVVLVIICIAFIIMKFLKKSSKERIKEDNKKDEK